MSNNVQFFPKTPKGGMPVSSSGVADGIRNIERALANMEVVGDGKIDARLQWVNGIPRITIRLRN
jgi:hypothetical protein